MAAVTSATRASCGEVVQREAEHAEDAVGAVDQRQPLLGAQRDRREAASGERGGGRLDARRRRPHLTLADQRERAVAERREVAAGAERAVLAHDGRDAVRSSSASWSSTISGRAPE